MEHINNRDQDAVQRVGEEPEPGSVMGVTATLLTLYQEFVKSVGPMVPKGREGRSRTETGKETGRKEKEGNRGSCGCSVL